MASSSRTPDVDKSIRTPINPAALLSGAVRRAIARIIRTARERVGRRWFAFAVAVSAAAAILPLPALAAGSTENIVASILGKILAFLVFAFGKLLLGIIYVLTLIAQYNNFIDATAVVNGWVIIRDVANMFFIVILLVIAFATILNLPNYRWQQMLPQLLLAAILINFSRTIAGILIDISQVVMLTFVNGFAAAAGGNFAQMLRIQDYLTLDPAAQQEIGLLQVVGGYLLALILIGISIAATGVITVILAFRIVMLWILVTLSPLPYLLNIIPQGKKHATWWWSEFGKYLTTGPVLAFFLWLALVSVGSGSVGSDPSEGFVGGGKIGGSQAEIDQFKGTATVGTAASTPESLLSFLIGIAFLIGGLKVAGESGGMGAGLATGVVNKAGAFAKGAAYRLSGARAVKERWQSFQGMREAARKERVQESGATLMRAYGTALAVPGKLLGKVPTVGTLADRRAQTAAQQAATARQQGDLPRARKLDRQAYNWRALGKWGDRGVAAASVIAAPVTGGASLAGLAAVAGRGGKFLQRRGEAARTKGRGFKYEAAMKALDAMKDTKKDDVVKKIPDQTASNAERTAAFLKAVKEGWVSANEVEGGEDLLQSLGADTKTVATFKSYAEQHYAGTMLKRQPKERQKRWELGTFPTKDLHPDEFEDGTLAKEAVLHATPEQRKQIRQSRALKGAYQGGLKRAVDTETDPNVKQKLQADLMAMGKGPKHPTTGVEPTAYAYAGMDPAAFAAALAGPLSSDVLANLDQADLAVDPATGTSAALDAIARNVNAARFSAAIGASRKPDADPQAAVNLATVRQALQKSARAQAYDTSRAPVRGAESNLAGVQKRFDALSAAAVRGDATAQAGLARAQTDRDAAAKALELAVQTFEQVMEQQGIGATERDLYDTLKKPKARK